MVPFLHVYHHQYDRLIRAERLRRDVAAYGAAPPTDLADIPVTFDLDDADVDYESDYR